MEKDSPSSSFGSSARPSRRRRKETRKMRPGSDNGDEPAARNGTVHVAFVLDKSGSMHAVEEAVVEGYNDYLRELREQGGETLFSLTTFDTRFEHVCVGAPL